MTGAVSEQARLLGPGFATRRDLTTYLGIGPRNDLKCIGHRFLKPNRVGLFSWTDIWFRLWRIRNVPVHAFEPMKSPLLTNADVAALVGIHERTIHRDGELPVSRFNLPDFLDLSHRMRRHHPMRIAAWEREQPTPSWLQPVSGGSELGLTPRKVVSKKRTDPTDADN